MTPELLLIGLPCHYESTRRSNLITSLPILALLLHVFICTFCAAQLTQMNNQWLKDDDLLKGDNKGGIIKICLIVSTVQDNQGQFIQRPKIEKPIVEKAQRLTAPAYSLPHQQSPDDIDCRDILSRIPLSFELGNNRSTSTPLLLSFAPNVTKMS